MYIAPVKMRIKTGMPKVDVVAIPRLAENRIALPTAEDEDSAAYKIMLTALEYFAFRGYGSTSIRDISKAAQVQPTTLYYHFPSKEHLLARLLEAGYKEHLRQVKYAYDNAGSNPFDQLKAVVQAHVSSHCDYPVLGILCSSESHHLTQELAADIVVMLEETQDILMNVFKLGISKKVFQVSDPYLALRAIGAMGSKVVNWYGPGCGRTKEQIQSAYVEYAIKILT